MYTILMVAGAVGLAVGSVAATIGLIWFLWQVFALFRHPEWGAIVIVALMALLLMGKLPRSELVDMTVVFALIAAIPLWIEGLHWRKDHSEDSITHDPAAS